jgi:Undecaprenyl-phosphate glucose phosphotransferase
MGKAAGRSTDGNWRLRQRSEASLEICRARKGCTEFCFMFKVRAYLTNFYLLCLDLTITAACFLTVSWVELRSSGMSPTRQGLLTADHVLSLGCVLGVSLASLFYFRMYHSRRMHSVFTDLAILTKASMMSLIFLEGLMHFVSDFHPSHFLFVRFMVANLIVLSISRLGIRICLRQIRRRGLNTKSLLVVASPELSTRLCSKLAQGSHYGYRILGPIEVAGFTPALTPFLFEKFSEALRTSCVDEVILGLPAEARELSAAVVGECESRGINVRLVPDLLPLIQSDTQVYDLGGLPLINVRLYPTEYFGYLVLKRGLDLAIAVLVLAFCSPVFFMIAALIKLTSQGPVLLVQERMGLNGKKFKMLKFRTMRYPETWDPNTHWTKPNDLHVTPLGRWLRRSNLDELPQFVNVLKGEMSLVGPRPERPFFIEQFRQQVPDYMVRHYVKCGITGWAQVNGWRGDTSIQERFAHDLYYVQHWALSFDFKILTLTLLRSFFHPNAY